MSDSRLIPTQFPTGSAPSAATPDPVGAAGRPVQHPSSTPRPAAGEFIMSGSLTPLDTAGSTVDLPYVPVTGMPPAIGAL